jgi:hypothetical protein
VPLPVDVNAERRGHEFLPHHIAVTIPALYETEDVPMLDKVVHAHYFVGGSDWWVFEYDAQTGNALAFVCLGDPQLAEVGYVNIPELEAVRVPVKVSGGQLEVVIERDIHWEPKPVSVAIPKSLHRSWWQAAEKPTT